MKPKEQGVFNIVRFYRSENKKKGDTDTTIKHVYDVTGTDDPFNP